jgi:hypothetical protein
LEAHLFFMLINGVITYPAINMYKMLLYSTAWF